MIATGKCPGCGKVPYPRIIIQPIEMGELMTSHYKGVMYVCPNMQCQMILGAGIDPIALKSDMVNEVVGKLRGRA
jgi:hypothetical protein